MTDDTVDLVAHARSLLGNNRYLTLGTINDDGRPWTTPVYFAAGGERDFYWVSDTEAQHSRNLAERPDVSIVVFDSSVEPFHGRAVYAAATARELSGEDLDRGLQIYPGSSERGGVVFTRDRVTGPASYRLYRATASEHFLLRDDRDVRVPVSLP